MQQIYYVDDDIDDLNIFSQAVKKIGDIELSTFTNADAFFKKIHEQKPSKAIVFLDINVPGKNGFFILKDLRNDPNFADIPVVMYSTSSDPKVISTARIMGANNYVTKPNDFNQLIETIKKLVSMDWSNKQTSNQAFVI